MFLRGLAEAGVPQSEEAIAINPGRVPRCSALPARESPSASLQALPANAKMSFSPLALFYRKSENPLRIALG